MKLATLCTAFLLSINFLIIRRVGIFTISIGNQESITTERNNVNRYGASIVRPFISETVNNDLPGRTECKNLHSRCQQRHVLRAGRC